MSFVVRALRARLRDQRIELVAIRRHVNPGDVVCDVGANKGSYLFWLARWCNRGQVIAFEPQPDLAEALIRLCASIGMKCVKIEQAAVCATSGSQDFFIPLRHQPGASLIRPEEEHARIRVPTVSLDDYFAKRVPPSMIKIDVEGAELEVLRGAERVLREAAPLIIVECENRHLGPHYTVADVFAYLAGFGYEGTFVCEGRALSIGEFEPAVHQRQDGEWFWKRPGYCNNFIFRRKPPGLSI